MTVTAPSPSTGAVVLRRAGRLLPLALLAVIVLVVIVYAVLPTRSWLAQRDEIQVKEQTLAELEAANAELAAREAALSTYEEIERIARSALGLVKPGEEAFVVLPPAPEPVRIPPAWPFTDLAGAFGG